MVNRDLCWARSAPCSSTTELQREEIFFFSPLFYSHEDCFNYWQRIWIYIQLFQLAFTEISSWPWESMWSQAEKQKTQQTARKNAKKRTSVKHSSTIQGEIVRVQVEFVQSERVPYGSVQHTTWVPDPWEKALQTHFQQKLLVKQKLIFSSKMCHFREWFSMYDRQKGTSYAVTGPKYCDGSFHPRRFTMAIVNKFFWLLNQDFFSYKNVKRGNHTILGQPTRTK